MTMAEDKKPIKIAGRAKAWKAAEDIVEQET
jgi:hypothetical protein